MTEVVVTKDMIEFGSETYDRDELNRFYVLYEGARYRVQLMTDYDSRPHCADCYSKEDIEAWSNDVWVYVGVIVTPVDVPEILQFELSDSLWGVEYNFPLDKPLGHNGARFTETDDKYIAMVHPVPDMINAVRGNVADWDTKQAIDSYLNS